MQKEKQVPYHDVLFVDSTTGLKFVCGTTITSDQKEMYEGRELPVVIVPISSASHPLFVGGEAIVDAEGRVDRFKKRQPKVEQKPAPTKASRKKA